MEANTVVWMDERTLVDGDQMSTSDAVDMGGATVLEVVVTVVSASEGEAPVLTLKHAPRNASADWLDFETPFTVDLTQAGTTWRHETSFTRLLGWELSGRLSGKVVVTIVLVGKR